MNALSKIWKNFLALFFMGIIASHHAHASKLTDIRAVDDQYLMVYFKDGEVFYRDDGKGTNAYRGHAHAKSDDTLMLYGKELDVIRAQAVESWIISSEGDENYGENGIHPVKVYRKSKVNNTNFSWEYRLDHWIFLQLPYPMKQGENYKIKVAGEINSDKSQIEITRDIFNNISEAVHVNIIGYIPESPVKSADLYYWLGDGGPRDYHAFEGKTVWLYDVNSKEKREMGKVSFWKESGLDVKGENLTGSSVWNADFNDASKPGTYRLVIDGVGCSRDFQIKPDIYFEPYKFSVRGYYYMRLGEDEMDMVPVPRRPLFIPGKDPEGFTVYITDLDPYDPDWNEWRGDRWDEPHFKPAKESMFWRHRLPGNPTNPDAIGGHSDAMDWDRHLGHVSNIYDLLLPYFITNGKLSDDDLDIAESGNGIPDIIDEARNEVDFWLSLRDGDAYSHGMTNPSREYNIMFQAGATTMAAWANAANCAMLGDCFRISGHIDLMNYYKDEAIKAFLFADKNENRQLDVKQEVGDAWMRGRDFRNMAAAFLYNLTGDEEWENIMAAESVVESDISEIVKERGWYQIWGTAAYLFCQRERHHQDLYEHMKSSVLNQAMTENVNFMDIRPSRRSTNNKYWQTPHNLQLVVLAHAISSEEKVKDKLERSMILEADYGLGRNATNIVEMTGLGSHHIVNCYTTGTNDGTPGLHPGQTPYNNLGNWGGTHNGSHPEWFTERGYPDWKEGGWPFQEAHFNCRYSWANGEFTPRQTMRGKMVLYGYLYAIR